MTGRSPRSLSWGRPGLWVLLIALLAGSGFVVVALAQSHPHADDTASAALVKRGKYLARAGDCAACHTTPDGQPYAGGRLIETPFGGIYSPNITPDAETGIGRWSEADFRTALRQGKAPDGHLLYPAFPFTSYTRLSDVDVKALYAWLRALPPVHQRNQPTTLSFPFSLRRLLVAWRALYFTPGRYQADADKSEQWNRGAYLVQGLGHCGECHSPRNVLGAVKAARPLSGALIPGQGWYAPNLDTGPGGDLQGWRKRDIIDLLRSGRSERGSALGPMAEVVRDSLQYLTDDDLQSIAEYLLDPPAAVDAAAAPRTAHEAPAVRLRDDFAAEGKHIYAERCAACHGRQGQGKAGRYPALAGNATLRAADPVNAVRVVLLGGFSPTTRANPRPYSMPAYVQQLNDRQVAAVISWLRQSWGNHASPVSPRTVRKYRQLPVQ